MIRIFLFFLALLAVARAEAASQTVIIKLGDISDITGQSQANPLRRLAKSLKQHPNAPQFRLIWDDGMGNFITSATAFYDRKTRVFKFYSNTSIAGLGNETVSNEIKHWMFRGVTDSMLGKLERKHRGAPDGSDGASYFSELSSYGAKKRDLGSHQVLSAYGKALRRHHRK